jgi:hypothetical protein
MIRILLALLALFAVALVYLKGVMTPRQEEAGRPTVRAIEQAKSVEAKVLQRPQELERQLEQIDRPPR